MNLYFEEGKKAHAHTKLIPIPYCVSQKKEEDLEYKYLPAEI